MKRFECDFDPAIKSDTQVETIPLEYIFGDTLPDFGPHKSGMLNMMLDGMTYGVQLRLDDPFKVYASWPMVRVSGDYENVFHYLAEVFGSNETFTTMRDFVGMCIGDEDAAERWNAS